jgi:cytochrome c oxidase assembly protein subunit 15
VTALGMFLVLVMGQTVTTTGSAQGCGRDWPLCHGRFVPDFAFATAIEFSHRAVTGVEGVLIVIFAAAALLLYGRQRPIRVLVPLMLGFLVLQAGMGAWAVVYPQQPVVLALHFGISLIALATTALTALYVRKPEAMLGAPAVSTAVKIATWGMAGYLYLLVYSGAYIRHLGAAGACPSWPLCGASNGLPVGSNAVAVNLAHRLAAAAALLLALALLAAYRRSAPIRKDLMVGALVLVAALLAQAGAGGLLVLSGWALTSELVHAALTGVTFTAAAYLCLRVTLAARPAGETAVAPGQPRLSAEGAP